MGHRRPGFCNWVCATAVIEGGREVNFRYVNRTVKGDDESKVRRY